MSNILKESHLKTLKKLVAESYFPADLVNLFIQSFLDIGLSIQVVVDQFGSLPQTTSQNFKVHFVEDSRADLTWPNKVDQIMDHLFRIHFLLDKCSKSSPVQITERMNWSSHLHQFKLLIKWTGAQIFMRKITHKMHWSSNLHQSKLLIKWTEAQIFISLITEKLDWSSNLPQPKLLSNWTETQIFISPNY